MYREQSILGPAFFVGNHSGLSWVHADDGKARYVASWILACARITGVFGSASGIVWLSWDDGLE